MSQLLWNFVLIQTYTVENVIHALGVVYWVEDFINFFLSQARSDFWVRLEQRLEVHLIVPGLGSLWLYQVISLLPRHAFLNQGQHSPLAEDKAKG